MRGGRDVAPSAISRSCNKAALNRVARKDLQERPSGLRPARNDRTHMTPAALLIALDAAFRGRLLDWQDAFARAGRRQPRRAAICTRFPRHYGLMTAHVVCVAGARGHRTVADVPGRDHPAPGRRPPAGRSSRSFRERPVAGPERHAQPGGGQCSGRVGQRRGASRFRRIPAPARHQPHGAHRARHGDGDRRRSSRFVRASRRSCARAIAWSASSNGC